MKTIGRHGLGFLVLASLCALGWHTALRPGLVGRYYPGGAWSGTPALVVADDAVSTDTVVARLDAFDDQLQSVSWDGFIHLAAAGSHTFTVTSTGAAWLFLDDRLLVDNGGWHETVTASATTSVAAGLHAFEVRYLIRGDDPTLELTTGFDGEAQTPIATSALFPSPLAYGVRRAVTLEGYLLPLLWSLVVVGVLAWRPLALFGGALVAGQLESGTRVWRRRMGVAALLLYGLCNGALVDVMMVNDARYDVERWLERPDHRDGAVRMAGFYIYLPRFDALRSQEIREYWPDVVETKPRFIVTNRGYSCRARPDSEEEDFYTRLANPANGYRRVVAYRYQPRWPPVDSARLWRAVCPDGFTNLAVINPEIQVFGRVDP